MNAVIKIDVVGERMNPLPFQRLIGFERLANGLEEGGVFLNFRVARHAGFNGRNSGERRRFHACVAVSAIHTQSFDVLLVAKRYGLGPLNLLSGDQGTEVDNKKNSSGNGGRKNRRHPAGL
jgi:hypothetical protein